MSLRVRDLVRSACFYRNVLGCTEVKASHGVCRLEMRPLEAPEPDVIELISGRPLGMSSAMDHFSVEASSSGDVDRVHELARRENVRVLAPCDRDGTRCCIIFDPDGYKIEVFARSR